MSKVNNLFLGPTNGIIIYAAPLALRWGSWIEMIGLTPYPMLFRTFGAKLNRESSWVCHLHAGLASCGLVR